METGIPEPLFGVLRYAFHVEMQGGAWAQTIHERLQLTDDGGKTFRRQFAHAILNRTLRLAQYVAITKDTSYTTEDELYEFLRETWSMLYGPGPITAGDC